MDTPTYYISDEGKLVCIGYADTFDDSSANRVADEYEKSHNVSINSPLLTLSDLHALQNQIAEAIQDEEGRLEIPRAAKDYENGRKGPGPAASPEEDEP